MKFKVGDRVIGIGTQDGAIIDGFFGTVKTVETNWVDVEFDKRLPESYDGNSMCGWGQNKRWWACWEKNLKLANESSSKIVITTDGTTTLARLYDGNKVIKSAKAKCSPDDTYDFATGANLAYDRLMRPTAKTVQDKPEPAEPVKLYCVKEAAPFFTKGKVYEWNDASKLLMCDHDWACRGYCSIDDFFDCNRGFKAMLVPLVKRPAKVGEWVYISDGCGSDNGKGYRAGDIVKVVKPFCYNPEGVYFETKSGCWMRHNEYLVLDGYTEEPAKEEPKYYSGKVIAVSRGYLDSYPMPDFTVGKVYTVSNGKITDNVGWISKIQHKTIEHLCKGMGWTFIEYKGEQS